VLLVQQPISATTYQCNNLSVQQHVSCISAQGMDSNLALGKQCWRRTEADQGSVLAGEFLQNGGMLKQLHSHYFHY
jgi:hypothetical protein